MTRDDLRAEIDAAATFHGRGEGGTSGYLLTHAQTDAIMQAAERYAEAKTRGYENAITWNTSCLSCAAVLDSCIAETTRREAAEAQSAGLQALLDVAEQQQKLATDRLAKVRELAESWAADDMQQLRGLAGCGREVLDIVAPHRSRIGDAREQAEGGGS